MGIVFLSALVLHTLQSSVRQLEETASEIDTFTGESEAPSQVRQSGFQEVRALEQAIREPFHAVAIDIDGVIMDHKNPEIGKSMRPLVIEKTLKRGVKLGMITGKEEADAFAQVIDPFRREIAAMGIELGPGEFMVYSNNGSVTIDAGAGKVLERKEFSTDEMERMAEMESVRMLLEIYDLVESTRNDIDRVGTHFRQQDLSTICFRIDPADLSRTDVPLPILSRIRKLAGKLSPSRFKIAEQMKRDFAAAGKGMENIEISATDRSIDLTPAGTGKRRALEAFSRLTGIPVDRILRAGDSPTGMDFGLTAAERHENRAGFSNVPINQEELALVLNSPGNQGKRAPIEIGMSDNQFENTRWLLQNAQVTAPSHSSPWAL